MKKYRIRIIHDEEANVWIAINSRIPLALEAETLDELVIRTTKIAPEILAENGYCDSSVVLSFYTECQSKVCV